VIVETCCAVDTRADAAGRIAVGTTFGSSANCAGLSNARPRPSTETIA
jgi:hypothetical protein